MKKMLQILLFCFTIVLIGENQSMAQSHQLVKKWQTDTVLKTPESVLYDGLNKVLYFSNIGGAPAGKNGKGSIGKLGLDGKVIALEWVTGLNGPKGLGRYNDMLYAADIDEVVAIDIPSGKIVKHIPVAGAEFLNDITVDAKGVVYVSDSKTGKVHRIDNSGVSTYVEGIKNANGVLAIGDELFVLGNGSFYKVSKDKQMKTVADGMDASTDGIEKVTGNDFLVSCWNGIIYYISGDGSKQVLLDTREQKSNTADIGYDSKNRIVYVPTFFKNSVAAYELK
ncbi:MAG: ATP/GTP-binding protein [Chitinophagales bacterium]